MLCSICRKIPALADVDQFTTAKSLQASEKAGCPLCKLIWSLLWGTPIFQTLVAGKHQQKPDKAEILLYYGSVKVLAKQDPGNCQKVWVSVGTPGDAGVNLELFNHRGK